MAIVGEIEGDNSSKVRHAFTDQVRPVLTEMLGASNAPVSRARERIERQAQETHGQLTQQALWVTGLPALALALATWLAWRPTRSVLNPLAQLEPASLRIAGAIAAQERAIERLACRDTLTN